LHAINAPMLITYADSMGKNLAELNTSLQRYFNGAIKGVHILPFFPSSSDRGFCPIRYDIVDPDFGSWADVETLSMQYYMMFDFMINHISCQSQYYQDFLRLKDASRYKEMFIRYRKFWPGGEPSAKEIEAIYKRKPRAPYVIARFADGTEEKVWCTFGDEQIDLAITSEVTRAFIRDSLRRMCDAGAVFIRLDAFAYAAKTAGGSCFFEEPAIWEMLDFVQRCVTPYGVDILPEMHEHFSIQLKLADHGYWVYDFALPMLLLYSLYTGETADLLHWLQICPRKQFTTLDTHDGIGVVDVRGLLTDEQIEQTRETLFSRGANVKRVYSTEAYHNLDIYQINCTYYSALGNDDEAYLTARAIQLFAPGIPQVYYVGLLAGKNDIELLERTKNGRDINRHSYTLEEIAQEVERPVVRRLLALLRFRSNCPAVSGSFEAQADGSVLTIRRSEGTFEAILKADVLRHSFSIVYTDEAGDPQPLDLDGSAK